MNKHSRLVLGAAALPAAASAHVMDLAAGGFSAGIAHTLSGLDHWVVGLGLGVWITLAGLSVMRVATFAAMAFLLAWWLPLSLPTTLLLAAASLSVIPLVVRPGRLSMTGGAALACAAVAALGFAHGLGMAQAAGAAYAGGAGIAMLVIFLAGALPVQLFRAAAPRQIEQ